MQFLTIKEFLCREFLLPIEGKVISEIFNSKNEVADIAVEVRNWVFKPRYKQHVLLAADSYRQLEEAYIKCLKSFCSILESNIERSAFNFDESIIRFKRFSNGKAVKIHKHKHRLIYSLEYDVIIKRRI